MASKYQEIMGKFGKAVATGNLEDFQEAFTSDATFRAIGTHKYSKEAKGPQEIAVMIREITSKLDLGSAQREVRSYTEGDNIAYFEFAQTMKTVSGRDYSNEYVQVFRFEDDKISSVIEYLDTEETAKILCTE